MDKELDFFYEVKIIFNSGKEINIGTSHKYDEKKNIHIPDFLYIYEDVHIEVILDGHGSICDEIRIVQADEPVVHALKKSEIQQVRIEKVTTSMIIARDKAEQQSVRFN